MAPSNKDVVHHYFTKGEGDDFKCRCGRIRKQKPGSGYANLMNHVRSEHPTYERDMASQISVISRTCVSRKALNIYNWITWVINGNHPLSFVDNQYTRKYTNLEPISSKTLISYMEKLEKVVENAIKSKLPERFAILIDGWSGEDSTHYLGIFAVYENTEGKQETPLLAMSPLFD